MAKYDNQAAKEQTGNAPQNSTYDQQILQTIPFYRDIHQQVLEIVRTKFPRRPIAWLDTGCGTGTLGRAALNQCKISRLAMCDPSPFMLDQAKQTLADATVPVTYLDQPSQSLFFHEEFQVATAIQSHHYLNKSDRLLATQRCYAALEPGGIFLTVENMASLTEAGKELNLRRWEKFQTRRGKSPEDAKAHIERYGSAYFPISLPEHLEVLHQAGFQIAEVFWLSYMQVGLFGIK